MKKANGSFNFYGFTVKEGFWYGIVNDVPTASSGWMSDNYVRIYELINKEWKGSWLDIYESEALEIFGEEMISELQDEIDAEEYEYEDEEESVTIPVESVVGKFSWSIEIESDNLSTKDIEFIEGFNPVVYCNDATGESWCFDTRMPSGRWLENIKMSSDFDGNTVFSAFVF